MCAESETSKSSVPVENDDPVSSVVSVEVAGVVTSQSPSPKPHSRSTGYSIVKTQAETSSTLLTNSDRTRLPYQATGFTPQVIVTGPNSQGTTGSSSGTSRGTGTAPQSVGQNTGSGSQNTGSESQSTGSSPQVNPERKSSLSRSPKNVPVTPPIRRFEVLANEINDEVVAVKQPGKKKKKSRKKPSQELKKVLEVCEPKVGENNSTSGIITDGAQSEKSSPEKMGGGVQVEKEGGACGEREGEIPGSGEIFDMEGSYEQPKGTALSKTACIIIQGKHLSIVCSS